MSNKNQKDKTPKISLLLIGTELLDGRILDTNKRYLGDSLSKIGLTLVSAATSRDTIEEISQALDYLMPNSDYIICSGGLGPTTDDLTREAIADYAGKEIYLADEVLKNLHQLYETRKRSFDPSNTKQATFPRDSKIIKNPVGTAAGFSMQITKNNKSSTIISLPGVPRELYAMLEESVIPQILNENPEFKQQNLSSIRIFGLPESVVGSKVKSLNLPSSITVSYLASFPEVKVTLKANNTKASLDAEMLKVKEILGPDYIFSEDLTQDLFFKINELLTNNKVQQNKTIAVAESCTGGLIGAALTQYAGASKFFLGGIQAYSNKVKEEELNISKEVLDTEGAVSHKVAMLMAKNVKERFQSSVGISITGISGPDGGSPEKPVGTFFIGISSDKGTKSMRFFFLSSRDLIRTFCVYKALDVLRRELLELSLPDDLISLEEV